MDTKQKSIMTASIIAHMRLMAKTENKPFSDGDLFFTLVFRTDAELHEIARLCGAL